MSGFPPNPDLEHFKKQAKALLQDFRKQKRQAAAKFKSLRLKAAPKLSDAQHLIAQENGFESWSKLKQHVESLAEPTVEVLQQAEKALREDDAAGLRKLLQRHRALKARINDPAGEFGSPPIANVRSAAMLDVLLEAGGDINARSNWWAGGFGLLDSAPPELAAYAIGRGAVITVHAAARLGMIKKLRELIAGDPALVHARGGDGQTPLHFASTVKIAEYLLKQGAEIDARDVDHASTPAQWMLGKRQEVARYLVKRGCKTDILRAAALGDTRLVREHLRADPECIRMRVSDDYFPMIGKGRGARSISGSWAGTCPRARLRRRSGTPAFSTC